MTDHTIVGKRGYRTTGFFAYRVGTIAFSDSGITDYKIVFDDGGAFGVNGKDVVLVEDGEKE